MNDVWTNYTLAKYLFSIVVYAGALWGFFACFKKGFLERHRFFKKLLLITIIGSSLAMIILAIYEHFHS
jgi:hypothetical protein